MSQYHEIPKVQSKGCNSGKVETKNLQRKCPRKRNEADLEKKTQEKLILHNLNHDIATGM